MPAVMLIKSSVKEESDQRPGRVTTFHHDKTSFHWNIMCFGGDGNVQPTAV